MGPGAHTPSSGEDVRPRLLMIGHESLVPRLRDFLHTYMGEEPVIYANDDRLEHVAGESEGWR